MNDAPSDQEPFHDLENAARMRERMRALIQEELEAINPADDARRALALIIEASLRPSYVNGELTLTVIDADGRPRTIRARGGKVPFTLKDLIAELRAAHPILFKASPNPPMPNREDTQITPHRDNREVKQVFKRDWLTLDGKASELKNNPASAHMSPAAQDHPDRAADFREELSASAERAKAFIATIEEKPIYRRPGFALGVVAAALLLLGSGAFLLLRPGNTTQAGIDNTVQTGAIATSKSGVSSSTIPSRRTLRGVPDVIDTATLSLEGEVVRLFGVEWAPGAGKPEELTAYLQGREVTCEPAGGNETYRCRVGEQDLSRVVLFNGGGQPTAEATPELKAAANYARDAKIGVWSMQP